MTSCCLLLTSLRDALVREGEGQSQCVREVQGLLAREGLEKGLEVEEGQDLATSRLLPSFSDRRSYFFLLLGKERDASSFQARAKAIFDKRIHEETSKLSRSARVAWLEQTVTAAVDRMGVTLCEIVTEVNMAQVFLWLQEKTLFGEASLVENKTPGVFFSGADLVRNLVLSPTLAWGMAEQEEFHHTHWLLPLERRLGDPDTLNTVLSEFVAASHAKLVSSFETTSELMLKSSKSISPKGQQHIRTYGKFCSIFEEEAARQGEGGGVQASLAVLARLATFVDQRGLREVVAREVWQEEGPSILSGIKE